jgi:hypothetical protein
MGPVHRQPRPSTRDLDELTARARAGDALDTGNLALIRAAAAQLPQVSLEGALRVCLAVRKAEPETYERAVVRWLGRFCLERRDATLAAVRVALEALARLPRAPD